jgi:hypothetical protein
MGAMVSLGTSVFIVVASISAWLVHATVALLISAPILFSGRKRVRWMRFDALAILLPFSVWLSLWLLGSWLGLLGGISAPHTWSALAAVALMISVPILFIRRERVQRRRFVAFAVVLPLVTWLSLMLIGMLSSSMPVKSESNFFTEAVYLSYAVPVAAFIRVRVGRRMSEKTFSALLVASLCVVAAGIACLTPIMPI